MLKLLDALATDPVLTIDAVAARHGVSVGAAQRELVQLADAGMLGRMKDQNGKLICWTADQYLGLVSLTGRSNRLGGGDTERGGPRLGPPALAVESLGAAEPASQ